jgi:hypothetical protein
MIRVSTSKGNEGSNPKHAKIAIRIFLLLAILFSSFAPVFGNNFRVEGGNTYETLVDAAANVPEGGTITMLQDVTLSGGVSIELRVDKGYTIDLGGYTLSGFASTLLIIFDGTVTIRNGSIVNNGSRGIIVYGATVSILDGSYTGNDNAISSSGTYNGTVTITSGHFVCITNSSNNGCLSTSGTVQILLAPGSTANVNPWLNNAAAKNVTVTAIPDNENARLSALSCSVNGGADIPVSRFSSTQFICNMRLVGETSPTANIILKPTPTIAGATITQNDGVTLSNGEGTATVEVTAQNGVTQTYTIHFTIAENNFQVEGESIYETLEEAVANVPDGGTITMLQDVTPDAGAQLYVNKTYTIELGEHTLSGSMDDYLLEITQGTVTIRNGNIINIEYSVILVHSAATLYIINDNYTCSSIYCEGKVYISGGNYTGSVHCDRGNYTGSIYCDRGGTITVTSGYFMRGLSRYINIGGYGQILLAPGAEANTDPWLDTSREVIVTNFSDDENACLSALSCSADGAEAIPVTGFLPTWYTYNVTLPVTTSITANITLNPTKKIAGATVTRNDGVTLSNGEGTATVEVKAQDGVTTQTYTINFRIARNFQVEGGSVYTWLSEALANVPEGGTITMLQDLNGYSNLNVNKAYTIDLGGHTLSGSVPEEGVLNISRGTVTIRNGSLVNTSQYGRAAIYVEGGACSVISGEYTGVNSAIYCGLGTVTITSGHFIRTLDYLYPGCLMDEGGQIILAEDSEADVNPWLKNAEEVTVTMKEVADAGNAHLNTLSYSVDGAAAISVPGFSPAKFTYDVSLPITTSLTANITINQTPTIAGATVTANNGVTLSDGMGAATVEITAQDGATMRTYTINFATEHNFQITGGNIYETLEEAVANVPENGTITMRHDVTLIDEVALNVNKAYTLDLGGHTLLNSRYNAVLDIRQGTVIIQNGSLISNNSYGIRVAGAVVSILDGSYTGFIAIYCYDGTVNITSGHFESRFSGGCLTTGTTGQIIIVPGSRADVDSWLNSASEVTITTIPGDENVFLSALSYSVDGGAEIPVSEFSRQQYIYNLTLPGETSRTADITLNPTKMIAGATVTTNNVTLSDGAGTATVEVRSQDGQNTQTYTINFIADKPYFQVEGGSIYEILEDAVANVPDGGTIIMLQDVRLDAEVNLGINKTYTLDLGEHTLSGNFNRGWVLRITQGTVTIQNGSLINDNTSSGNGIAVTYGVLHILSGNYTAYVNSINSYGTVIITAGHFTGYLSGSSIFLTPSSTADVDPWQGNGVNEVTITALPDDENAFLSAFSYSVDGGAEATVPRLSSEQFYNVRLPITTSLTANITLNATPIIASATIVENNGVTLSDGAGQATVKVTSPDGATTLTYTINFTTEHNFQITGGNLYRTIEEAVANVPDGGTITMRHDVTLTGGVAGASLNRNKTYVFDLGGHTISGSTSSSISPLLTISDGRVTIQNGNLVTPDYYGIGVSGGTLSILSGNYTASYNAIYCWSNSSPVIITEGHFISTHGYGCLNGNTISLAPGSTADVDPWQGSGISEVTITSDTPPTLTAREINRTSHTEATVNFTADKAGYYYYQLDGSAPADANALVSAGTNETAMTLGEQTVNLITLTTGAHTLYIVAKSATDNVSDMLTIAIPSFVNNFRVEGGNTYETLDEAVANVPDGGTITMMQDVTLSSGVTLNLNKAYTLDLGEHTISGNVSRLLTIGEGTVTIRNGNLYNDGTTGIKLNSGSLSILSGNYTSDDDAISCDNGTVTITSGYFRSIRDYFGDGCLYNSATGIITLASGSMADVNPYVNNADAKNVTVTVIPDNENALLSALSCSVNGGADIPVSGFSSTQFICNMRLGGETSPTANITLNPTTTIAGATITRNDGVTLSNGEGTATVEVTAHNGATQTYTIHFTIAENNFLVEGGIIYETLDEAVANVPDGGTITMLQDITPDAEAQLDVNKTYTLDLGGHTILRDMSESAILAISQGTVTIRNGNFINVTSMGIYVTGGTVSILGGNYTGNTGTIYCDGGTVTVTSGHFTNTGGEYGACFLESEYDGQIFLAPGSAADIDPWQGTGITEVTVSAAGYALTVSSGAGGSVSGTASGNYILGAAISVTATAAAGYIFNNWTVSGTNIADNRTNPVTFDMPANTVMVTANFMAIVIVAPSISTTTFPDGMVGMAYSQTPVATGDAPIAWSIDSGALPAGLTLNAATGEISGTPTAAGRADFTLKASNGGNPDATKNLSIVIAKANPEVPARLTAVYGQTLADITLPTGWAWDEGSTVSVGNAGAQKHNASHAGDANHNAAANVELNITIARAVLIVSATDMVKVQGEPNPVFHFGYTGFVNGETEANLTVAPSVSTTANLNSVAGIYDITVSGGVSDNYAFEYHNGVFTILGNSISLLDVSVATGTLVPEFDMEITEYTLNLPCGEMNEVITVRVEGGNARFEHGDGNVHFDAPGRQTVRVIVTANDRVTMQTYSITLVAAHSSQLLRKYWDNVIAVNLNAATNGGYRFTAFQWTLNGEPIPMETGAYLHLTDSPAGRYGVILTTSDGLTLPVCEGIDMLAINVRSNGLKVYPNPAVSNVTVENQDWQDAPRMQLYDMTGHLIREFNSGGINTTVNVNEIPSGTYILKAGNKTTKLMIGN